MDARQHWDTVYQTKADADLSWFQPSPAAALALIDALRPLPQSVIDIGGGQSALAGELVARGIEHVGVLDISSAAVQRGQERLGAAAAAVHWMVADVLVAGDLGTFDLWHDRAVFHFLTEADDRRRYVAAAAGTVRVGGHAIISAFAPTGPEKCSGLAVCRYDAPSLSREFGPLFVPVASATETHQTPWGKAQDFIYVTLRRV